MKKIITNLFFFDENNLTRTEKHLTWEDAYLALLNYAEKRKMQVFSNNSAVSDDKKQVIQIIQKFL